MAEIKIEETFKVPFVHYTILHSIFGLNGQTGGAVWDHFKTYSPLNKI